MGAQQSFESCQQVDGFCAWRREEVAAAKSVIVRFVTCPLVQSPIEAAVRRGGLTGRNDTVLNSFNGLASRGRFESDSKPMPPAMGAGGSAPRPGARPSAPSLTASRGIVRAMASYDLPHCLRITIGTDEEVQLVGDALAELGRCITQA